MTVSALGREQIARAIEATAPVVVATDFGWQFQLGLHPHASKIDARVDDDWLLLDMPLESAPFSHARLIEINSRLRGGVKFALSCEDDRVHVRAELPLLVGVDIGDRLFEAGCGFEQASEFVSGRDERADGASSVGADSNAIEPDAATAAEGELDQLCEEAGLVFSRRPGGSIAVEFVGAARFFNAQIRRRADGAVALSVAIEKCQPSDGVCEDAAAIFLLRCCAWLRMVRGAGTPADECVAPRFEVVLSSDPSPGELSEALAALAVAARFGANELRVLARSERVARSYLEWNAHVARCTTPKESLKATKAMKPKGKRRSTAATERPVSTRRARAKRSSGTRKNRNNQKEK